MVTHIGEYQSPRTMVVIQFLVLIKFTPEATQEQKLLWREEVINLTKKCHQVRNVRYGNRVFVADHLRQNDPGWEDGM